jgi:hypothetical protein
MHRLRHAAAGAARSIRVSTGNPALGLLRVGS